MKINICMSYYNRKPQLLNTVFSIASSKKADDVKIILVDDGSDNEHRITSDELQIPSKIIYLPRSNEIYNCGYPNNLSLQSIDEDAEIIILQNPENYHIGDIIDAASHVQDNEYIAFACYYILEGTPLSQLPTNNFPADFNVEGWVCHSKYKPNFLNYVCAFTPNTLHKVGMFDNRFYKGVCFDDNEWVERIHHLGVHMSIIDNPYAKHQFHQRVHSASYIKLEDINRKVRNEIRKSNNYNWDSTRLY